MSKAALCIGLDYVGSPYEMEGGRLDAKAWAEMLDRRGFDVRTLIEEQATKSAICKMIAETLERAGPGGLAVITYAGHGTYVGEPPPGNEDDAQTEEWVPYEYPKQVITDDEIYELLAGAEARRAVVISDSCMSGTITKALPDRELPRGRSLGRRKVALYPKDKRGAGRPDRALAFSACLDREDAWYDLFGKDVRGVFSHYALEVLPKLPSSATFADWCKAVIAAIGGEYDQTPSLDGKGSAWRIFEEGTG